MTDPAAGGAGPGRLVTVAHGTRKSSGNRVAAEITRLVGERLGLLSVAAYVELCEPLLEDVLATSDAPTVVVPLLLSTGYHLRQDLPRACAGAGGPVTLGRPLGAHALLAVAQLDRLRRAGWSLGQPVVLLAAGSTDPGATRDLGRAAELLARACGARVRVATLSGLGRRPEEVVRPGDAVSPYLLAGGFFADRGAARSREAGASVVADVLGPHPRVVDLTVRRTRTLLGLARRGPTGPSRRGGRRPPGRL